MYFCFILSYKIFPRKETHVTQRVHLPMRCVSIRITCFMGINRDKFHVQNIYLASNCTRTQTLTDERLRPWYNLRGINNQIEIFHNNNHMCTLYLFKNVFYGHHHTTLTSTKLLQIFINIWAVINHEYDKCESEWVINQWFDTWN